MKLPAMLDSSNILFAVIRRTISLVLGKGVRSLALLATTIVALLVSDFINNYHGAAGERDALNSLNRGGVEVLYEFRTPSRYSLFLNWCGLSQSACDRVKSLKCMGDLTGDHIDLLLFSFPFLVELDVTGCVITENNIYRLASTRSLKVLEIRYLCQHYDQSRMSYVRVLPHKYESVLERAKRENPNCQIIK